MSFALEVYSAAVKPDLYILMSKWAEDHFVLPRESTKEHGRYRIERTPFVREILDELSPMSPTTDVTLIKPTQLAGTTIAIIFMMCIAHLYPGPLLFITVTVELAKRFSKKRITPSINLMPCLEGKITTLKSRDARNTILTKEFPGGSWLLTGSNAAASYRSEPAKYVILDDYDGFALDIEGEGDPGELADRRTTSFSDAKIYKNSTPTLKGTSNIERDFEDSSQGFYNVPCPHCQGFQYLKWGGPDAPYGVKFIRDDDGQVMDVWYECEHCHGKISEHHKSAMLDGGKYIHKYPSRSKRGFRYNALYSPLGWKMTWKVIAEKFLAAAHDLKHGKPQKMKAWTNTIMAETWEEEGEALEWESISQRRERYPEKIVPEGGLFLTCGVDTHDNRLALVVRAWGRDEQSWLIYHTELWGDPNNIDVWMALDQILDAQYEAENASALRIVSVCVDSQGHRTQAVYSYCRSRLPRTIAIQGVGGENKPILGVTPSFVDVDFGGEKIKNGCQLWSIGVYQAKVTIYARLRMAGMGAGVYHFHESTTDDYFKQLTAERLQLKYVKGFARYEWVKDPGRANEALDCETYAYAAAIRVGMGRPGFWDELEKIRAKQPEKPKERPEPEKKNGWIQKKGGWLK